jgi:hypothetical protein
MSETQSTHQGFKKTALAAAAGIMILSTSGVPPIVINNYPTLIQKNESRAISSEYKAKDDIKEFLAGKNESIELLKALPSMIESICGKMIKTEISIYEDYEEGWKNVIFAVYTNKSFEEEQVEYNKLFDIIEADQILLKGLEFVTVSFR